MVKTVTAIPAFSDNYIWAIGKNKSEQNSNVVLVDPGDAQVCINYLQRNQLNLVAILITHHHQDHVGGIKELVEFQQQHNSTNKVLRVYGPANENIPCCTHKLSEGDLVNIDEISLTFHVLDIPGHTSGHIAYFSSNATKYTDNFPLLFCGDTLFSGGCGRLFEGTAEQMLNSLNKLAGLPQNTKVYCAHEYTLANLKFALEVEPNNQSLLNYVKEVKQLRANNQATIPTTISLEKQINPFLRTELAQVKKAAQQYCQKSITNSVECFSKIRAWKDNF